MNIIWRGNENTNFSERRGYIPCAIVNHITGSSFYSADNWFRNSGNEVSSAHFIVAKDGKVYQYVDIHKMAWANGITLANIPKATASIVKEKGTNPNYYTVSIEHEGTDGILTPAQLQASVELHKWIQTEVKNIYGKTFELNEYSVIGHFQIDPVRKPYCPGLKFPWAELYKQLKEEELDMNQDMAKFVLAVLGDYWTRMEGNKGVQDYTHACANEVRRVAELPIED